MCVELADKRSWTETRLEAMQDKMENWAEGELKGGLRNQAWLVTCLKVRRREVPAPRQTPDVLHLQKSQLSHPA